MKVGYVQGRQAAYSYPRKFRYQRPFEMIANTRNLLSDVVGFLTGLTAINESNKTLEVLQRSQRRKQRGEHLQQRLQGNLELIGRIVIQLITGGVDLKFTLENGPAIISQNMKKTARIGNGFLPCYQKTCDRFWHCIMLILSRANQRNLRPIL